MVKYLIEDNFNFYDECNTIPGNSETRLQTYLQKNKINIITYDIEFCHINQNKQLTQFKQYENYKKLIA